MGNRYTYLGESLGAMPVTLRLRGDWRGLLLALFDTRLGGQLMADTERDNGAFSRGITENNTLASRKKESRCGMQDMKWSDTILHNS